MHEVIRTVKGRQYRYLEESVRTPRGPRKRSIYLGPLHALTGIPPIDWKATFTNEPGAREAERGEQQAIEKEKATQEAARKAEDEAQKPNDGQEKAPPNNGEADTGDETTPSSEST